MEPHISHVWTPAVPLRHQRKVSFDNVQHTLEEKLVHRPEKQHLIDAHILPNIGVSNIAPSIAASLTAVQFQRIADGINTKLRRRPTREDLINNGVIRVRDPNVAPSLQGTQTHLEFQRHAINVAQKLHHRPSRLQLVQDHIIVHEREFDVGSKVTDAILSLQRARTIATLEDTIASKRTRGPINPLDFLDLHTPLQMDDGMDDDSTTTTCLPTADDGFLEGDFYDDEDGECEYYTDSDYEDAETRSTTSDWALPSRPPQHDSVSNSYSSSTSSRMQSLTKRFSMDTDDDS